MVEKSISKEKIVDALLVLEEEAGETPLNFLNQLITSLRMSFLVIFLRITPN